MLKRKEFAPRAQYSVTAALLLTDVRRGVGMEQWRSRNFEIGMRAKTKRVQKYTQSFLIL